MAPTPRRLSEWCSQGQGDLEHLENSKEDDGHDSGNPHESDDTQPTCTGALVNAASCQIKSRVGLRRRKWLRAGSVGRRRCDDLRVFERQKGPGGISNMSRVARRNPESATVHRVIEAVDEDRSLTSRGRGAEEGGSGVTRPVPLSCSFPRWQKPGDHRDAVRSAVGRHGGGGTRR